LTLSPASLTFTATQGAANPANQSITLTSNGSWTAADNASWLTVSPTSGFNNGTLTVSVNTATAAVGNNTGTITVTGGGITRTVSVSLTLNAPATSSATLTWNANTESDLDSYRIYRSTTPGVYGAALATVPAGIVTYQATGLQTGTTYYFTVTAIDTAGNESPRSNEVSKSIF
jgi:predicted phage tail protein